MNNKNPFNERITGALVGLAIGDALGAPFENMSPFEIAAMLADDPVGYVGGGDPKYRPGEGTDDTELALLVSSSLLQNARLDMPDISRRLVTWGKTQKILGPSTGAGLRALELGVDFRVAGSIQSASSGCLPRCMPLALVFPLDRIVSLTIDCCLPTHRHPLAVGSSVAQNLILCALIQGDDWMAARDFMSMRHLWEGQVDLLSIHEAVTGLLKAPGAVDVLAEAIQCVDQAHDAEAAVATAVRMGGDTDTRAAVAGSLAGARWGSAFPLRWLDGCEKYADTYQCAMQLCNLRGTVIVNS